MDARRRGDPPLAGSARGVAYVVGLGAVVLLVAVVIATVMSRLVA